jgi:hypothetical protein
LLLKTENRAIKIFVRISAPWLGDSGKVGRKRVLLKRYLQPGARSKTEGDFFIWIRRNSLKSLDSAKGIQGNASDFPWFSLESFGFAWSEFSLWLNVISVDR